MNWPGIAGLALALAACGKTPQTAQEWRAHYGAEVAEAEDQAHRTAYFEKVAPPIDWGRFAEWHWGSGMVDGWKVQCARFNLDRAPGRTPATDRAIIYDGRIVAETGRAGERFDLLWRVGGCESAGE